MCLLPKSNRQIHVLPVLKIAQWSILYTISLDYFIEFLLGVLQNLKFQQEDKWLPG